MCCPPSTMKSQLWNSGWTSSEANEATVASWKTCLKPLVLSRSLNSSNMRSLMIATLHTLNSIVSLSCHSTHRSTNLSQLLFLTPRLTPKSESAGDEHFPFSDSRSRYRYPDLLNNHTLLPPMIYKSCALSEHWASFPKCLRNA